MTDLTWLTLIALAAVLIRSCRSTPLARGEDFLKLMASGILPTSKKAHTRGDLDHRDRTRRQRAHAGR